MLTCFFPATMSGRTQTVLCSSRTVDSGPGRQCLLDRRPRHFQIGHRPAAPCDSRDHSLHLMIGEEKLFAR